MSKIMRLSVALTISIANMTIGSMLIADISVVPLKARLSAPTIGIADISAQP